MLPKKNRLVREKDIRKAYKSRWRIDTRFSQIILSESPDEFRLLIVVSKKIYKKANKRFRIKRKLVAIFEELKAKGSLPPEVSCIIKIKNKDILLKKKEEIYDDIVPALGKLYQKTKERGVDKKKKYKEKV